MDHRSDPDLHARLIRDLGDDTWAAAIVTPGGTRLANHGITARSDLEIGSISKGITALLYVDAIQRGEVSPEDTLGAHLPLDGAPASWVTLASLSTHRSGLPTLPTGLAIRRTLVWLVHQRNPYGDSLDELLAQVQATSVGRARPLYSNLGYQLLGHAVAAAAGRPYRDLVAERIARPLGLTSLHVPTSPGEVGAAGAIGRSRFGRIAQPWTGEALGPAGGIRMSITDVARLATALLDETAPGFSALDPVAPFIGHDVHIGAAWITSPGPHGPITWHNGGTGGFRTWLGLDRRAGTAVAILRGRAVAPDRIGARLLTSVTSND